MPDPLNDQRLKNYAARHGRRWSWETEPCGDGRWKAIASLHYPSAAYGWCFGDTEQAALDEAIAFQISTYDYVALGRLRGDPPSDAD
jgi:hypothetical protein